MKGEPHDSWFSSSSSYINVFMVTVTLRFSCGSITKGNHRGYTCFPHPRGSVALRGVRNRAAFEVCRLFWESSSVCCAVDFSHNSANVLGGSRRTCKKFFTRRCKLSEVRKFCCALHLIIVTRVLNEFFVLLKQEEKLKFLFCWLFEIVG